jgi:thioredoxin-related protein
MKLATIITVIITLAILPLISGNVRGASETIRWYKYEEGLKLGTKTEKKIFLTFRADWCKYCKLMEGKTFTDAAVITAMNREFIAIKVDSDKDKKTASHYRVQGLPASFFLSETGEIIGELPGYIPPEKFIPILSYVGTDSYKSVTYKEFLQSRQ